MEIENCRREHQNDGGDAKVADGYIENDDVHIGRDTQMQRHFLVNLSLRKLIF